MGCSWLPGPDRPLFGWDQSLRADLALPWAKFKDRFGAASLATLGSVGAGLRAVLRRE